MRILNCILVVGLLFTLAPFLAASDIPSLAAQSNLDAIKSKIATVKELKNSIDKPSAIQKRRFLYYQKVESALTKLLDGDQLSEEENTLLVKEGIIRPDNTNDELDERGGPDEFGYEYVDSQEDDGPEFNWIDISDTGEMITGLDNDITLGPFDIGFEFPFYGENHEEFYLCAHGWLSFTSTNVNWTNTNLPDPFEPNNLVAFYWDDFIVDWYSTAYYETMDDMLVVQIEHDNAPCQVQLFDNGTILMMYNEGFNGPDNFNGGETIGIENEDGTIGLEVSNNEMPADYPFGGLAIKFSDFEDAFINGVVTDVNTGDPIEGAEMVLYYADTEDILETVFTNDLGEYSIAIGEENTFDLQAYFPGYIAQTIEDIEVLEEDVIEQDFALDEETTEVLVGGTVVSADTPDTPLMGVVVALPQLGEWAVTNFNGVFNLGDQLQGLYTVQVGHTPVGSEGYHNLELTHVEINADAIPLNFELPEIMEPGNLTGTPQDGSVALSWDPPANHQPDLTLAEIDETIQIALIAIDRVNASNLSQEEKNRKIEFFETKIHRARSMRNILEHGGELDQITDYIGYRIKQILPNGTEIILDNYIEAESFTVPNLLNGTLYTFQVAADYGYDEEYLAWSEPFEARPMPAGDYLVDVVDYEWIEINPNNGGDGEILIDNDQWPNPICSELTSIEPLTFNYFGIEYDEFAACTKGWMSLTDSINEWFIFIPDQWPPNASLVPFNGDFTALFDDDDFVLCYLVDEENNRVVVQWSMNIAWTDFSIEFQAVLDCEDNSIQFNYNYADFWDWEHGGPTGIEDEEGEIAYIYPWTDIEDETSIRFMLPDWDWNGINGVVLDESSGDPVHNAQVVAVDSNGDSWRAATDITGWYTVLVPADAEPYDLSFSAYGYYSATVENVTVPAEEFDVTLDDVLLEVIPIGYYEDFEDEEQVHEIWTLSENNIPGDWEWGIPTEGPEADHTQGGENCWATVLDGNHTGAMDWNGDRGDTLLTTESWYIGTEDAMVVYWHWIDYFMDDWNIFAGYNFQISTDFGETWEILEPDGGYTGDVPFLGYFDQEIWNWIPEPGFSGQSDQWVEVAFPVGDYTGEEVMFMFQAAATSDQWLWRYGVAIDDFRIHGAPVPGVIEGLVTDSDSGDPIEDVEVTLRLMGDEEKYTTTDETGYYYFDRVTPTDYNLEDYTIDFVAAYYVEYTEPDVYVPEGETITVDVSMAPQTDQVTIEGTLWSADTPDTPVPTATITIPQLEINVTTDVNGEFSFGQQVVGTFTFEISYENPQPNHFQNIYNVVCHEENMPLDIFVSDIMPPQALAAEIGDLEVQLSWDPPANQVEQDLLLIGQQIEALQRAIDALVNSPHERMQQIYSHYQSRLFSLTNTRNNIISAMEANQELDELSDFMGYRLRIDGVIQEGIIEEEQILITGLENGHEYAFAIAADYGYGDNFLVFTDDVLTRPLPDPGYIFQVVPYTWTEINPDEGGDGEILHDDENWPNFSCSDMISIDPLSFEFYGEDYDELCASSKGWMSFTTTGDFWWIDLPATWLPNATVVPFNGDWTVQMQDDDFAIYSLIDEGNNEVVVQFDLNIAWMDWEKQFQVVLDCDNNSMLFNYNHSDNWEFGHFGPTGVENEDGTIASIYPWEDIHDEMSILVRFAAEFGNVVGTVTTDEGDPVPGAHVYLMEDPASFGTTDENGNYEILLVNIEDAPFTVVCHADGYEHEQVDGVNWDDEEFDQIVDFVVTEISPETPPYFVSWDEDFDDRVRLVMGEPGVYQHLATAQHDDGIAADAWVVPTENEQNLLAYPFEIIGEAQIIQTELRVAWPENDWGNWPDEQPDPVVIQVFNDNQGYPGDLIHSSEEIIPEDGLVLLNEAVDVAGRFWIGYYSSSGQEALCVDAETNYGGLLFYSVDGGENWSAHETNGDPLIRLELLSSHPLNQVDDFEIRNDEIGDEQPNPISPVAVTHQSPVYGFVPSIALPMAPLQPGWSGIDELDEFLGFNIYYSLDDGANWNQDNVDPVAEDIYDLVLGSELEDNEILVYLTATVDTGEEIIESNPSDQQTMVFNMEPGSPEDLQIVNINHTFQTATIIWDPPTENADGTPLVDLVEYDLYRDGQMIATIPFDQNPLQYDEEVVDAGYYTYSIVAKDEVPNISNEDSTEPTRIGEPPFWSSFEPNMVPEQPNPFEPDGITWEWGEPGLGPQGGYDDTDNCWATLLDANYLAGQEDWLLSTHAWDVIGQLRVIYYHWYDFDWDSGYNLQVSADNQDTWTVVSPEVGYPDNNVWGLQEPGFSGSIQMWQRVEYDLSEFNDADSIHIAFRFRAHDNIWEPGYGVAIDNLEIWGVPREARGWVEGFVMDANDQPMQGAHVYLEDVPVFQAFTNANGYYMLMNAPAGEHNVICEYPYYWPHTVEDFEIIEDDTLTLDFTNDSGLPMLFPDGELETTAIEVTVNIHDVYGDTTGDESFDLESIGTGPLDWNAYVRVLNSPSLAASGGGSHHGINPDAVFSGPKNNRNGRQIRKTLGINGPTLIDPSPRNVGPVPRVDELDDVWDVIISYDVSTAADNDGILAAVTTEDTIFISASFLDDNNGENYLYSFNHQGFLFNSYEYPAEMLDAEGRGFSDLAYSPFTNELFGANADGEVYRFTPDFTEYSLVTTVNFWPNAIAYDWDNDLLYLREWGNDFAAVDPISGNITNLDIDNEFRSVSGMAYMPRDGDGYTIWMLYQVGEGSGGYAFRYDPLTFEYDMTATEVYSPDGNSVAGGMEISLGWRSDFYDITTINQSTNDYVDIWEGLISPPEWVWLEPTEGTMDPGETHTLTVNVDLTKTDELGDLEAGMEIYAEIVFGGSYWANTPVMDLTILVIDEEDSVGENELMPTKYALYQNYPNPFNPMTTIRFDLVQAQNVKLSVFNVLGQEVAKLANERFDAGYHQVAFVAEDLASGIYFYRIETPAFTNMKKMVLVK